MKPDTSSAKITSRIQFLILIALAIIGVGPAKATTDTFNLTGDTANLIASYVNGNPPSFIGTLGLTNSATGLNQISGFTLSVGDIINGTVDLNNAITVPSSPDSQWFDIDFLNSSGTDFNMSETVTFYHNGVQVTPGGDFNTYDGSGGYLSIGGATTNAAPAFTFDEMVFTATVTSMLNASNSEPVSSVNLPNGTPDLRVTGLGVVPEPSTWTMIAGAVPLWLALRRRQKT